MANNAFASALYGEAGAYDKLNGGYAVQALYSGPTYKSFPVVGTLVHGISPGQVISPGITANSIIEVFPPGLTTPGITRKYFSDQTEAALNALRQ